MTFENNIEKENMYVQTCPNQHFGCRGLHYRLVVSPLQSLAVLGPSLDGRDHKVLLVYLQNKKNNIL